MTATNTCPSKEVASFRVAAAIRGRRSVPCVLLVQLPAEEEAKDSPAIMHLHRAGEIKRSGPWEGCCTGWVAWLGCHLPAPCLMPGCCCPGRTPASFRQPGGHHRAGLFLPDQEGLGGAVPHLWPARQRDGGGAHPQGVLGGAGVARAPEAQQALLFSLSRQAVSILMPGPC